MCTETRSQKESSLLSNCFSSIVTALTHAMCGFSRRALEDPHFQHLLLCLAWLSLGLLPVAEYSLSFYLLDM